MERPQLELGKEAVGLVLNKQDASRHSMCRVMKKQDSVPDINNELSYCSLQIKQFALQINEVLYVLQKLETINIYLPKLHCLIPVF